jgi:hypothetical protein
MGVKIVEDGNALYGHTVEKFRNQLEKTNLKIVSVDASFEELRDIPEPWCIKLDFLVAPLRLLLDPTRYCKKFWSGKYQKAIDVINTAGKLLQENGIALQFHAHGYEFMSHAEYTLLD